LNDVLSTAFFQPNRDFEKAPQKPSYQLIKSEAYLSENGNSVRKWTMPCFVFHQGGGHEMGKEVLHHYTEVKAVTVAL
jgi:hypothetical protein